MAESQQPDTVPPPPGDADLYSAETRVGPLPAGLLDSLRRLKEESAELEPEAPPLDPEPAEDLAPISVPARSMTSEDLLPNHVVPDMGGSESESTEPNLDKPIRFIKRDATRASLPSVSAANAGVGMRNRGFHPLLLLVVVAAGLIAAFLISKAL